MEYSIASRYEHNCTKREPYLRRARRCAKLTIPMLVPPKNSNSSTIFKTPFQSIGARGLNNLTSKYMLTLFPPNLPFFKLIVDNYELNAEHAAMGIETEVENELKKNEKHITNATELTQYRVSLFETIRQILCTGNILINVKTNSVKVYALPHFTLCSDIDGNIAEIIALDHVIPETLPENIRQKANLILPTTYSRNQTTINDEDVIEVYHHITHSQNKAYYKVFINDCEIDELATEKSIEESDWIVCRTNVLANETYGRSYVEEYLGDLKAVESLSKAIIEGSAIASRSIFLVNPYGVTKAKTLAKAANGDFVVGRSEDVEALQLNKHHDYQLAENAIKTIGDRLAHAFLLNSAIQRNAERVTAEEIRYMSQELETAMGGMYAMFSTELQLPFLKCVMAMLQKQNKLPKLPDDIKAVIVTGVSAISRASDFTRMQELAEASTRLSGTTPVLNQVKAHRKVCVALGLDADELIMSEKELEDQQQQQQNNELTPSLVKAGTDLATATAAG